jgi:hypothetical protein
MAKLQFDELNERKVEAGVDKTVFFPGTVAGTKGVAWNGVTSISDSPEGGDANDKYADNMVYVSFRGAVKNNGTVECLTYPYELDAHMGRVGGEGVAISGGPIKPYCLAWHTLVGNAQDGIEASEKLSFRWNASSKPFERQSQSLQDNVETSTFSVAYSTVDTPVNITEEDKTKLNALGGSFADIAKLTRTSAVSIEKNAKTEAAYNALCDAVYGTDEEDSKLLTPSEVIHIIANNVSNA